MHAYMYVLYVGGDSSSKAPMSEKEKLQRETEEKMRRLGMYCMYVCMYVCTEIMYKYICLYIPSSNQI